MSALRSICGVTILVAFLCACGGSGGPSSNLPLPGSGSFGYGSLTPQSVELGSQPTTAELPNVANITGTMTFPAVARAATLALSASATAPAGVSIQGRRRTQSSGTLTVYDYITTTPTTTIVLPSLPAITVKFPASTPLAGKTFFYGFTDPNAQGGLTSFDTQGPGIVTGQTVTFPAVATPLTLPAGHAATFIIYATTTARPASIIYVLNEAGGPVDYWKTSLVAKYNAQGWPLPFDNSHLRLYQPGGNFAIASSITTDGAGNVFVGAFTPFCCGFIQIVKPDGSPRTPLDRVDNLNANVVAVSPDGTLYAASNFGNIRRFNTAGTEIIDPNWLAGCGFVLAVDANGKIYTACYEKNRFRIAIFNPDGTRVKSFITGVEDDAIAVDSAGKIYVADWNTRIVTTYNADGSRTTPTIAPPKSTFAPNLPIEIAVDGAGKIYVSDSSTNMVTTYNPDGTRTTPTITFGLDHPVSISVR